jgi:stress-induced-phosphoprotein 1
LSEVKKILDSQGPPDPTGGLKKMFSDPNMLGKLAANPKTSAYMADPTFVAKLKALQTSGGGDFGSMLQDPRMMTVLGVLMGIDLVSGDVGRQRYQPGD